MIPVKSEVAARAHIKNLEEYERLYRQSLDEPERFRNVAHGLHARGHSEEDITKILGGNWLRYFRDLFGG